MKNNIALYILRLSMTLLIITAVVAAVLAGVNAATAPVIAQIKAEKIQAAIQEVLPGAAGMEEVGFTDDTGLVHKVYMAGEGSDVQGYVAEVVPAGFGGGITMMVGVRDGVVTGICVVSHAETAGLGSVAGEANSKGEAFRGQFVGMSGVLSVDKDGGQVDSITSATVTSRAVTTGVNAALAVAILD